ncbi:hypothetical protein HPB48_010520 [Haemaphysalis longicornis]|uniref:Ionotropic receptor n=1 Tax=Haemaphysalis longicornis TaxID=44386 RepID=A0A9J6H247_HAELO|nr:hypothetical protein HPB48_010520 [Haemaphysalis longicornis]
MANPLVLTLFFSALCCCLPRLISPHRIQDVALSARHPTRLVLLWLNQSAPIHTPKWTKNLELPVLQWTRLGDRELNELRAHVSQNTKIWVLVPWSEEAQREELFSKLNKTVFGLSLVRFVVALEPGERLPYEEFQELSCILVGVNDTAIDVAEDSFRKCDTNRRILTSPSQLSHIHTNDSYTMFNSKKLIVVTDVTNTNSNVSYSYTMLPEPVLLWETLLKLNATLVPYHFKGIATGKDRVLYKVHRKKVDISLFPTGLFEEADALIDVRAINAYRSISFFSREGTRVPPRIFHTIVSSCHLLVAVTVCGFLVLGVYLCQTPLHRTSLPGCVLYLISIVVGRGYPPPPPCRSNGTRILALFWAVGMVFVCTYLQSMITSEVNVPPFQRQLRNSDDLVEQATAKKVLPCVHMASPAEEFIRTSKTAVATTLNSLLENCSSCLKTWSGRDGKCLRLAMLGTHVFISVYGAIGEIYAHQFGVRASEDNFRFSPSALMMPKNFPCGAALKRTVTGLLEHGHQKAHLDYAPENKADYASPWRFLLCKPEDGICKLLGNRIGLHQRCTAPLHNVPAGDILGKDLAWKPFQTRKACHTQQSCISEEVTSDQRSYIDAVARVSGLLTLSANSEDLLTHLFI